MTTYQENEYSRNNALANFLSTHTSELATLPHFNTTLTELQTANSQINTYAAKQQTFTGSAAQSKKQLRAAIEVMVADYIRKLKLFATFTNNTALITDVLVAEKAYRRTPDTEFSNLAKGLAEKAQANIAGLATYEITADMQTALAGLAEEYDAVITAPREAIAGQKANNTNLMAAFRAARAAIKNMNLIVDLVKDTKRDLYNGYKTARKIVNNGAGQLSIRGKVTDAATGQPLQSVIITIQAEPAIPGFTKIKKKSTALGGFNTKGMPQGTYLITAVYPAYATQSLTASVYGGQLTDIIIQLQRG